MPLYPPSAAGTPGGSTTQVQYNNAGAFGGASGVTTNGTELTIASGTKTADAPILNATQTWNNGATVFVAIKMNVTDTASSASSLLVDLQVAGASKFSVSKAGAVVVASFTQGAINISGGIVYFNNFNYATRCGASSFIMRDTGVIGFDSSTTVPTATDTLLTRRAAANLRMGNADAASPVAQTLSVQSVVAGTASGTAGVDWTFDGSQGTGTGAGGSIIHRTAPAHGADTVQGTLTAAHTINSAGAIRFNQYGAGSLSTDSSGNITATSDARLKSHVGPFDRGLADVLKIDATQWRWNRKAENASDEPDNETVFSSFTAQAVEAGVPEAVHEGPDGMKTVYDRTLIAALINSVRELNERLLALEPVKA